MTKTPTVAAALIALAVSLTGCAADPSNKTLVVLQHPASKDVKECKGDPWANWNPYAATEQCAVAYERSGYIRMGAY